MAILAGIEAGGTKFVCGIGGGPADLTTAQFQTSLPDATIAAAVAWIAENPPAACAPWASDRSALSI